MFKRPVFIILTVFFSVLVAACSASGPAMVTTANPHASKAASNILAKGGSAIDAAIAAQMVLGLVEPQSSGIGGGAFALYWDEGLQKLSAYDGRETAPATAGEDLFLDINGKPIGWRKASVGGRAVGAPGVIALAYLAHQKHGRLDWADLFEPAIELAENGFAVSGRLNEAVTKVAAKLRKDAGARAIYFLPDGKTPLPIGHILKNREYAKTLRIIAQKGPDGFYKGEIAEAIVAAVNNHAENPGSLSLQDLEKYTAIKRKAVCSTYRSYKVCGMPPPTSGGLTTLMILGLLEPFDMAAFEPGSAMAMHLFTQASRLAYADRNVYIADDDFIDVPAKGLLDKAYLQRRARLINPVKDMGKAKPGLPEGGDKAFQKTAGIFTLEHGTSHLSIVDGWGNAISMTTSVERRFGAHITARGFMLNNQLTDFAFVPRKNGALVANRPQPGKRPRSSMSPTIIFDEDGKLFAALGSPGGSRIIEFTARTIIGLIDWKLSMQEAISLGNVNNRNYLTELEADTNVAKYAAAFKAMGHKVKVHKLTSGIQGIRVTPQRLEGGADPRREGMVIEIDK